jgi:hypothetical protein
MKNTKKALVALTLGGSLSVGGAVAAQQGQPSGTPGQGQTPPSDTTKPGNTQETTGNEVPVAAMAEVVSTTGTVQSIDRDKRMVVLKDDSGDQIKVQVPPNMPNFDQLKKGQKVDLTYHDAVAVFLLPPGAGKPGAEARVHVQPAEQGGLVGHEMTVTAQIVNTDTKNHQLELKLPSGQLQKVDVTDPDLQKQLKDVKPGQMATISYTEAVAASIAPASNQPASR